MQTLLANLANTSPKYEYEFKFDYLPHAILTQILKCNIIKISYILSYVFSFSKANFRNILQSIDYFNFECL